MDFFNDNYNDDYEEDYNYNVYDDIEVKKWSFNKLKLFIIIGILIFVFLVFFIIYNSPSHKYGRIENKLIEVAKNYVNDNYINVEQEIYLDVNKLNYDLNDECSKTSGVFYDGYEYHAYLSCKNYESKIVSNDNNIIKLNGSNVIVLVKGMAYVDPGYHSIYDVETIGEVGTEEGVYNLYYHATDDENTSLRKVVIIDDESLSNLFPSISLNGDEIININNGEEYLEEGVIANDNIDGDITDKVIIDSDLDNTVNGQYRVVYTITNSKGYTNNTVRIVNVVDKNSTININYLITPSTMVNTNVSISLKISGSGYAYTILPDNSKVDKNKINYVVDKNGKYVFNIYDKAGNKEEKEIEITNIDKEKPTGTCDAIIYDNYANIIVNSLTTKNIKSYDYYINDVMSKKQLSSTYRFNSSGVTSAKVTLYDSVGNTNSINCEVANYLSWKADYSKIIVYLKDINSDTIIKKYTLEDYLKGLVYTSLGSVDYSSYTSDQLSNLFKLYFLAKKSELFYSGKYDVNSKELVFRINSNNSCDVNVGCKLVNKNNKNFYLSNDINYDVDVEFSSKEPLDSNTLSIMSNAYRDTKKELLTNSDFNNVLTNYSIASSNIIDNYKDTILEEIKNNSDYNLIIQKLFNNYKVYNIDNYSNLFEKELNIKYKYWWPVGSEFANNGVYDGYPESVNVIHTYGASSKDNKIYDNLAIKGECNKTNVVSVWSGKVLSTGNNSEYGNYVIIDHGSGVNFVYGSLMENTIAVRTGESVKKGSLIGKVGKMNNECMLYLQTSVYNAVVNPYKYISTENVRPSLGDKVAYVEGGSVKETVCLTLLETGYSPNAVAGIMANIERESNFNLRSVGDGGTSVGLVQWHDGRWENLSNYCKSDIYTAECQLNFMIYELKNRYKAVYSYVDGNYSAYDIAYQFCYKYEIPAAKDTTCAVRGENARDKYLSYVTNGCH